MSAEAFAIIRSVRVGARLVTYSIPSGDEGDIVGAFVEWEPDRPSTLSDDEREELRQGQQQLLRDLSISTGREVFLHRESV